MDFQFATPTRLILGRGRIAELPEAAARWGKRAFVVLENSIRGHSSVQQALHALSVRLTQVSEYVKPAGEPEMESVNQAADTAREGGYDLVISIGGGSAIDLGKTVAGLVTNGGNIQDYLEGVGSGREANRPSLPHIAVPTTAGTGAEVTRNAVIRSASGRFKKSFRSPYLYPAVAILDAGLTVPLPPEQTAYSGMDAITQLIESFICQKANPITDALALAGLSLALPAIREVYSDGSNLERREAMLLASTLSGICLANAGLGLAHGFASGLGALYDVPHGKACAILLPHALKFNRCARLEKLARIGRLLTTETSLTTGEYADLLIQHVVQLNQDFNIPQDLKPFQIPKEDHALLVEMSMGNSMAGNPVEVVPAIARTILEALT
ncbi:MAG TPA: iron-containing alcohol dehydrogenase [bacterium]|nr:iron-containing alcohol dehydrogenase [bacterium]